MTDKMVENITRLKASILGLLSSEKRTQSVITQRLTTAGFKDKEKRKEALNYLLDNGFVQNAGNIVPMMAKEPKSYKLSDLGKILVKKINAGEVDIIG